MLKKQDFPISEVVVHPGIILNKVLESREIKQKEFADELGIAHSQLNEIIKGKRNITADLAILLEASLKLEAKYWLDLQTYYNLDKSRYIEENQRKVELLSRWASIKESVPISYLKKCGYLVGDPKEDEIKLKEIYNVQTIEELINLEVPDYAKFKISDKLSTNQVNLIGFVKLVEYLSKNESLEKKVSKFKIEDEREFIDKLKKAFLETNIKEKVIDILASAGIKLIIHEKPDQVPVDGMAFWSNNNPTIVLTLRHKRIDNFAFTLFHELGHVLKHVKKGISDKFIDDLDTKGVSLEEEEANDFAENNLIPREAWQTFISRSFYFDDSTIQDFSKTINMHPAVIRGRLCYEGIISYKGRTSISYAIN